MFYPIEYLAEKWSGQTGLAVHVVLAMARKAVRLSSLFLFILMQHFWKNHILLLSSCLPENKAAVHALHLIEEIRYFYFMGGILLRPYQLDFIFLRQVKCGSWRDPVGW